MDEIKKPTSVISRVIFILFLFFIFLLGIKLLGGSFKLLGNDFASFLVTTTSNPFVSLFIGVLATVLVQSSSVTTSMIVGMVSGGTLTIAGAIPMIMGANIGTSVTNSLVSVAHLSRRIEFYRAFSTAVVHDFFNIITVCILFPIEIFTGFLGKSAAWAATFIYGTQSYSYKSPIKIVIDIPAKAIKGFLLHNLALSDVTAAVIMIVIAMTFIFIALVLITKNLKKVLVKKIEGVLDKIFSSSAVLTIGIGILVTVMVQSSSITTSILVPLAASGVLSLRNAFPITLGANIGTTCTALLATLAGNISGLTIALVHLLFNLIGIAIIYPIPAIREIPLRMAEALAERTSVKKRIAFYYIGFVFFIIPLFFIVISRMW
jgi:solute carrier family 34 (sodium-dependent phosphate cotransporter)